jgi:hypothetical protein
LFASVVLTVVALSGVAGVSLAAIAPPPIVNADADRAASTTSLPGSTVPTPAQKDGYRAVEVWVDDDYTSGGWNDGHTWGIDAFDTVQAGISAVDATGTVHVAAGTYVENLTIDRALALEGAGFAATVIHPALSAPGGDAGPSMPPGTSHIIVVSASDVVISGFTLDGDNPALVSGIVRHGADIDARNGVITTATVTNLVVHDCHLKNIYLRGIYARNDNSTFHFHDNTVRNVDGGPSSIAIFAWHSSGIIESNTVSDASDAISANHSRGIQFLHNIVTASGSGVHTDNNNSYGDGIADVIHGNEVSNSQPGGYGAWVFFPNAVNPVVDANIVTNVDVGLFAWGGAGGTGQFTGNTVDGQNRAGSIGIYVTPGPDYWGSWQANVAAAFSGNSVSNTAYGFYLETDEATPFFSNTTSVSSHTAAGHTFDVGVWGLGTFAVTGLSGNTVDVGCPGPIQLGIDLANADGSVNLNTGTYTENAVINKSLSLLSTGGRTATTIEGLMAGAGLGTIQVNPGVNNVVIGDTGRGLTIIGIDGPPGLEKAAVYFQGAHANVVVRDNEIRANGDEGLMTEYNAAISAFTIDSNTFSGQTFLGTTPGGLGFAEQFTLPNVPRQLVVMGGGATGTNGTNVAFTNNLVTGTAGGLNSDGLEQGNTLVTIDTDNSTFTGNTFSGITTRYAVSLRGRRPGAAISGNTFSTTGLASLCGHILLQNNAITDALVAVNTFDRACYIEAPAGGTIGFHVGAAVAVAPAASILKVLPGTYTENAQISVARDLSIVGTGPGQAILKTTKNTTQGGNVPSEAWIYNGNGISLALQNLTLDGTGALINHALQSRGSLMVEDCAIRNIRYGQYHGRGIVLYAGAVNTIRRTTFGNIERIGIHVRGAVDTPLPVATMEEITYVGKGPGDWLDYGVEFGGGGTGSVTSALISNCQGVALVDSSASAGILATDYFGLGTQATVTGSVFDNCTSGISVGYVATDLTTVMATGNSFATCVTGITARHITEMLVSAHNNWWGDATGPLDASDDRATGGLYNPGGLGVPVTDGVDYDPWNLGNIVCNPDPQMITAEDGPEGGPYQDIVTVTYLGGLSGPLYGYSVEVVVDPAYAAFVTITRPATGPFASAALFQVVTPGSGTRVVDAALGGAAPGALLPCDLFTITFQSVANTPPAGTPITVGILALRDGNNTALTGGVADPGLLFVDTPTPSAVPGGPAMPGIGVAIGLDGLRVLPNPLPGRGEIRFALPAPSPVTMELFDAGGRLAWRSFAPTMPAGAHVLGLEARDAGGMQLPAGAYLLRVQAGTERVVRRVIVVR